MKKTRIFLFCTVLSIFTFNSNLDSFAKLPVEYGYFQMDGLLKQLPLAELEINGKPINKLTTGVDPVTINSRTLVPVRALSQQLGYKVSWSEKLQRVTVENSGKKIELFIGDTNARVNNKTVKINDSARPIILNSSTYVPIRFVVENMGLDINYDEKKNKISLNSDFKPNDINEMLFEKAKSEPKKEEVISTLNKDTKISQKDNSKNDPSVPLDVDKFVIKNPSPVAKLPEIQKPKEPEKPVVEKVMTSSFLDNENTNKDSNTSNIEQAKYTLKHEFKKNGTETFTLKQDSVVLDSSYFYLSNPRKLVIDVKNATNSSVTNIEENFNGDVFKSLNSLYHQDGNYTRYAILLNESIGTNDLKITKNGNILSVERVYKVNPGNGLTYSFDRTFGKININANKNIGIENISYDERNIRIKVPKDAISLNSGEISLNNRLTNKISIKSEDQDYIVEVPLLDRVTYTTEKNGNSIILNLVKQNRTTPVIVLDAGHGGKDPGAENYKYLMNEKTLNLQVVTKLKEKLEGAGYKVILTRAGDTFVPLNDIAMISNQNDPEIFISIHHNSSDSSSSNGIESFYYNSSDSQKLANLIQKNLIKYSGAYNRGTKSMPFVVIKKTNSPATLLELGFMSNDAEIKNNMSDAYQNKLAEAILSGVNEYFGR